MAAEEPEDSVDTERNMLTGVCWAALLAEMVLIFVVVWGVMMTRE